MHLVEGSVIMINLTCGCSEKRVTVIEGRQRINCSCGSYTLVDFSKNRDGSFEMLVH